MLPEAKNEDLLYVAALYDLKVYSYPKGKHVGTIKGFYVPEQECTDKSGDVFATEGDVVYEFAHGGKKAIRTFRESGYDSNGCASDPTTGDLAITWSASDFSSFLAVYPNGTGTPATYRNGSQLIFCGYDNAGNLYIDGYLYHGGFSFEELPKGGSKLQNFSLNQTFYAFGPVKWVGKYLTVEDGYYNIIYRFTVSGSSGTLEGTTSLAISPCDVVEAIQIQGNRVLVSCITEKSYQPYGQIYYYKYPQGGSEIKNIQVGLDTAPDGMVVSVAPSGKRVRR
jgi:hypothetical protein